MPANYLNISKAYRELKSDLAGRGIGLAFAIAHNIEKVSHVPYQELSLFFATVHSKNISSLLSKINELEYVDIKSVISQVYDIWAFESCVKNTSMYYAVDNFPKSLDLFNFGNSVVKGTELTGLIFDAVRDDLEIK